MLEKVKPIFFFKNPLVDTAAICFGESILSVVCACSTIKRDE